jgi:hypothetical protein
MQKLDWRDFYRRRSVGPKSHIESSGRHWTSRSYHSFLERCSGTFDLHGEIANADAFIRYCFEHAADAEAFHAQFAPAAEKAILSRM